MPEPLPSTETEFEIGIYLCPITKHPVRLTSTRPRIFVEWPMRVEHCPGCGQQHVVKWEEIQHPPIFGYE